MANTTQSTNMLLPIPVVGTDPGPDWALNINSCLNIIDSHDHTAGYGVQITPNGLNINTDLPLNSNNLTLARTVRLVTQSAPLGDALDIGCLYEVGDDLYYNDGLGNQIRITQSGAVAGTPGSIANLVSPASASYVSANSTFVWQSAANTPANMDAASLIIRNLTANSEGVTLQAPTALGASYTLTLPQPPASQKIMTLDNSGNMAAPYVVDNSTIEISSNTIRVKALGITSTQLADASVITSKLPDFAVTKPKLSATTIQVSASSGSFNTGSGTYVDVTNLELPIALNYSRPVLVTLIPDGVAPCAVFAIGLGNLAILRAPAGGSYTTIAEWPLQNAGPVPALPMTLDQPFVSGTYSYKVQIRLNSGTGALCQNVKLNIVEL